jgi:hypothetical protein
VGRATVTATAEDRLAALRAQLDELDLAARADEVRDRVPELVDELEPRVRQARIRGWELVRALIGALLVLPRVLVRVLRVLPGAVETAADRSGELADRARHAAARTAPVQRARRRRRKQLALWTAGGFLAGAATGWLLARRRAPEVRYEATQGSVEDVGVPSVNGATPVATDAVVRE